MRAVLLREVGLVGAFLVALALAFACGPAAAAGDIDHIRLVTYGPEASTREGDDDFVQVLFFEVPADTEGPIRVRLFDPDAGGELDAFYGWGAFDTSTRFSLYGGSDATTASGLRGNEPSREEIHAGTRLAEKTFAIDGESDGSWVTLAEVAAAEGESVGERRAFKLVVEGISGNDGNVFDFDVVGPSDAPIEGLRMYSYVPTIHHATRARTAEVRILPSGNRRLYIHSFDAAGAGLRIETPYRTLPVDTSGQNKWSKSEIRLTPEEQDQVIALDFGGDGGEVPNDATLFLADENGLVVPIQLPISLIVPNRRPRVSSQVSPIDCEHAELDASSSTDAEGQALSFEWVFADGTTSKDPLVRHRFGTPGEHAVRLRVTDDSGQVGSGTEVLVPVSMNAPPKAVAGADQTVAPGDVVRFDSEGSEDSDGRLSARAWSFGDGEDASGQTASHRYDEPGRYTVTLEVLDDSRGPCATGADQVEVWVNAAPTPATSAPDRGAVGEALAFNASASADEDGSLSGYEWEFGDGGKAAGVVVEHAYEAPGTYVARLTVTDDAGVRNSSASAMHEVFVNDPPVAHAGKGREVAIGEPFAVDGAASQDSDGKLVHYAWSFGDGATAEGSRATHEYAAPGRYEVRLEVRDDSRTRSDRDDDTFEVVVNAPPVAEAGPDQRVTASEVRFDASASSDTDGEVVAHRWSFGDGATAEGVRVTHAYAAPGTYRVDLRVVDDSPTPRNTSDDVLEVVVNARPVADAGPDRIAAVGQEVVLSGAASRDPDGSIVEYRWSFGDGASARERDVTHAWSAPGEYSVQLEVVDDTGHAGAVDHDELTVLVNTPPVPRLPAPPRVAPGEPLELDGSGSFDPDGQIVHHRWSLDGAPSGEGQSFAKSFDLPGSHEVTLVVDDGSGTASASAQVTTTVHVNSPPAASAGPDQILCEPVVTLDGTGSTDADGDALRYLWDFGDGSPPGAGARVTHVYADGGSYPVALRVDDGTGLVNSSDVDTLEVRVNRAPVARAGADSTVCAGETVLFDASESIDADGDVLRYGWDFGDGASGDGLHPVHVYENAGSYPVTLTVQDDSGLACGHHRDRRVVRVAAAPVAAAGADVETCAGVEVVFDGSASTDADGTVDRFSWNFGDGSRGNGPRPAHRFARPGLYRVVLTVEGDQVGECDDTDVDDLTVEVSSAPDATIEGPSVASPGEAVILRALAGGQDGVEWNWDLGDGARAEGEIVEHTYATAGDYDIVLSARVPDSDACGEARRVHRVRVNHPPRVVGGPDRLVAPGEPVGFSASGTEDPDGVVTRYAWSFGDGHEAEGVEVFHRYDEPGSYRVSLTTTDDSGASNASSSAEIGVRVNAPPVVEIDAPGVACVGQEIVLDASRSLDGEGDELRYRWDLGDGSRAEGPVVRHRYERPGIYPVTVLADDGSGAANATALVGHEVRVNRPPEARGGPDRVVCPAAPVVFDGSASRDLDGEIVAHEWQFGEGEVVEGPVATRTFDGVGSHRISLLVTDDSGSVCETSVAPVTVRVDATPVADAGPDRTGYVGGAHDALVFDGRGSSDADGETLSYAWDFGDGTTATGAVVWHGYERPGRYFVRLRVSDGTGLPCGEAVEQRQVVISERTGS